MAHVTEAGECLGPELEEIDSEFMQSGVTGDNLVFILIWHDWLNLCSPVAVKKVIASAGLSQEYSRGANFREDFPDSGVMSLDASRKQRG